MLCNLLKFLLISSDKLISDLRDAQLDEAAKTLPCSRLVKLILKDSRSSNNHAYYFEQNHFFILFIFKKYRLPYTSLELLGGQCFFLDQTTLHTLTHKLGLTVERRGRLVNLHWLGLLQVDYNGRIKR